MLMEGYFVAAQGPIDGLRGYGFLRRVEDIRRGAGGALGCGGLSVDCA